MTIHVAICDDDPIVRNALVGYMQSEDDLTIDRSFEDAESLLEEIRTLRPDVVLMDLALPGMDGITATRTLSEQHPEITVLVLTTFGTDEQVKEAIGAWAAGFLLKSTTAAALVAAVRAAMARAGTVITPELAAHLAIASMPQDDGGSSRGPDLDVVGELGLTGREIQVLQLLCAAESNAGIARSLVLSESTVKTHVSSLMMKLDCTSRLQVAVTAFERGLVTPPRPAR